MIDMKKKTFSYTGELTASISDLYKLITCLRKSGGYIDDKIKWCIKIKNTSGYDDGWELDGSMLK